MSPAWLRRRTGRRWRGGPWTTRRGSGTRPRAKSSAHSGARRLGRECGLVAGREAGGDGVRRHDGADLGRDHGRSRPRADSHFEWGWRSLHRLPTLLEHQNGSASTLSPIPPSARPPGSAPSLARAVGGRFARAGDDAASPPVEFRAGGGSGGESCKWLAGPHRPRSDHLEGLAPPSRAPPSGRPALSAAAGAVGARQTAHGTDFTVYTSLSVFE